MTPGSKRNHPYHGQKVALATKHEKEHVVGPPLQEIVGLEVCVPPHLDTDVLGTFSGEIPPKRDPSGSGDTKGPDGNGCLRSSFRSSQ